MPALLVRIAGYLEEETGETCIIFDFVHGNVTNVSCLYVGE